MPLYRRLAFLKEQSCHVGTNVGTNWLSMVKLGEQDMVSVQSVMVSNVSCMTPAAGCRDLQQMLKAWDAMRLGKDAQIAALIERCKRYEEEKQEQARTVESLRRKIACIAPRPGASGVVPDTSDMVSTHSSTGSRRSHMQLHLHMHPASSNRQPATSVTSSPGTHYLPGP
jgi:hypothetical protein